MSEQKGLHVIFEGLNGVGKTTILNKVVEKLKEKNHEITLTREPGQTETGKKLREILLDPHSTLNTETQMFLMLADRSENMEKIVLPALEKSHIVIQDRSYMSSMVFQSNSNIFDIEDIKNMSEKMFTHNPLWIHIESDMKVIRERLTQGVCDTFEKEQLQKAQKYLEKYRNATSILDGHTLYNNGTVDDCVNAVMQIIIDAL